MCGRRRSFKNIFPPGFPLRFEKKGGRKVEGGLATDVSALVADQFLTEVLGKEDLSGLQVRVALPLVWSFAVFPSRGTPPW